jgi:hypothetical protein
LVAVTEHVPVPLDIVIKAPPAVFEQAPDAAKVTVPVPLPPELLTVNVAPYACAVPGTPVTVSVACVASLAPTVAATDVALL